VALTIKHQGPDREDPVSKIRHLNPKTISTPRGYSHVVEVTGPGRIIYIAGQIGTDRDGKIAGVPGDARAQMVQAFENLKAALVEVGATFNDVVRITNYLLDIAHLKDFREVRDTYVNTSTPPASTLLVISRLAMDGLLFEIDAVAVLPEK
jgi:enamine deaminase RidA (YjgF/YER057c/UK114 family)